MADIKLSSKWEQSVTHKVTLAPNQTVMIPHATIINEKYIVAVSSSIDDVSFSQATTGIYDGAAMFGIKRNGPTETQFKNQTAQTQYTYISILVA